MHDINSSINPDIVKMKSSSPLSPLPTDCIEQKMYSEEGVSEGTFAHLVLEKAKGFSYQQLLGELMYSYITCRPDIGYAVTTLSNCSFAPTDYHYKLLKGVVEYLRNTIDWGIRFKRPKRIHHPGFQESRWYNIPDEPFCFL